MAEEISRKALLVLVIIAVLVSVLSTTLVMNSVVQAESTGPASGGLPSGQVSVTVPQAPPSGIVSVTVPESNNV